MEGHVRVAQQGHAQRHRAAPHRRDPQQLEAPQRGGEQQPAQAHAPDAEEAQGGQRHGQALAPRPEVERVPVGGERERRERRVEAQRERAGAPQARSARRSRACPITRERNTGLPSR